MSNNQLTAADCICASNCAIVKDLIVFVTVTG